MLRSFNLFSLAIVLICSSLFDSQRIFAQSIWLDKGHDKTISLEILKPDFDGDDNTTFATSASFLSGRFRATNNIFLVGEIPFAHLGVDSDFGRDDSENTLGNPYFGIELHGNNSPLYGEIGVRLPLAPDTDENEAAIVGLFTELVDRAEAFISDAIPISGAINYRHKNPTGFVLRLRGGSALWIETGEGDETELFLLYSVQAGYESSKFNFIGGFTGRWWLNEDGDFGERTFHQLGLAANVAFGVARPGISFRVPLDEDMTDILDIVYGLTLSLNLM